MGCLTLARLCLCRNHRRSGPWRLDWRKPCSLAFHLPAIRGFLMLGRNDRNVKWQPLKNAPSFQLTTGLFYPTWSSTKGCSSTMMVKRDQAELVPAAQYGAKVGGLKGPQQFYAKDPHSWRAQVRRSWYLLLSWPMQTFPRWK